jgi:hypothetical protein
MNSGVMGAVVAGIITQRDMMSTIKKEESWTFAVCRHCGREIHRKYPRSHFFHTGAPGNNIWCYPKKSVKRWKNTVATPSTETDIAKRILKSYEV